MLNEKQNSRLEVDLTKYLKLNIRAERIIGSK